MKISGLIYLWIPICITASCPNKCLRCRHNGWCLTCEDGYYTSDGTCYKCGKTGCLCGHQNDCYSCLEGFFFTYDYWVYPKCDKCMASCRSCTNDASCSACKPGFHGRRCEKPCSSGCINTCNINGRCQCKPNFTGSLCETCIDGFHGENCSQQCSPNCSACSDANSCIMCTRGYYGPTCQLACLSSKCANGECNRQSGFCSSCVTGYTGYSCNETCSSGCVNETCDQYTEKCTHTCKNGLHGDKCEYSCPPYCQLCTSMSSCSKCEDGFHGDKCEYSCPSNCQSCNDVNKCSKCKDGFYGLICQHNCSEGCSSCDDGRKCLSCKANYTNPNKQCQCTIDLCSSSSCTTCTNTTFYPNGNECCPCSRNCKHAICASETQCSNGCEDGYYGHECKLECNNKDVNCTACIGKTNTKSTCTHCKSGNYPGPTGLCIPCPTACWAGKCNSSSGYCQYGCQNGYWGGKCDQKCKANCSSCDQNTEACLRCTSSRYYGGDCDMPCDNNCFNMSCHINGTCTSGCNGNYYGSACETSCSEHCARGANEYTCSSETGMCTFGCVEGFTGGMCMQAHQQGNGGRSVQLAAIGAGVSALVIVVIAVAIGVFVCNRRRGPKPKSKSVKEATKDDADLCAPVYSTVAHKALETTESLYENTSSVKVNIAMAQIQNEVYTNSSMEKNALRKEMTSTIEDTLEIDEWDSIARQNAVRFEENGGVYYNNDVKVKNLKIPVTELQDFVMSKNMEYFKTEFEKLPYGLLKDYTVSQMKANIGKNRYKDIYPYDDYRVKVVGGDTDYINASFIDGYKRRKQYIATLGPMSKQIGNFGLFWSMAWQHKVEKIVMLTNLVEEGKDKCEQYWPSVDAKKIYGDIQVSCQSEDDNAEFTTRIFTVVKDKETRTITQLHFTSWPDKDVPENVTSIIEFRLNVIQAPATLGGPIIVHCSAGVGRTGTYIAIDILTKEGEAEGAVDIPGCVLNMRQNRPNMVQTVGQYEYLHHAVVHSLMFNCKPVAGANFQSHMHTISQDQIMKMFHQLQETTSRVSPDEAIAIERNAQFIDKNREASDIPGDEHRPRLFLNQKPGSTDYVNAVFVNSFQTKDKYLLAQSPLPNTVSDFLALIVQADCSCVVSFEPTSIPAKGIGVYLPVENQILNKGIFSVRCSKPEVNSYRIKRTLSISQHGNEAGDVVSSITHMEFTDWDPEHCVPRSTLHFRRLIDEVDDATANMDAHRPILIHCLDGASKCGLFCVVASLLQKMKADHEVSVENDVRKIKTRRKGAIPNLEQFQFCHSCVLDYIQSFDIYYNTYADGSDV